MQLNKLIILSCLVILVTAGSCAERTSQFEFTENDQGIGLTEAGKPVFFYQREPKTAYGRWEDNHYNNYLHPLYSVAGDTLTEEFPADHPYHRGIFWAWHQVFVGNESAGNGWVLEDLYFDIAETNYNIQNNAARLDLDVYWNSSIRQNNNPFIHEQTSITVYPLENDIRKIDFEISLRGLVPDVSLGGADNERGYGGYCLRIKTPDDLVFTSANGRQPPLREQTPASSWMDFSGSFGPDGEESGLTLISHPETPNYPPTWILRQTNSMQNIVFPGSQRTELPMDTPVVLKYRLILHNGSAGKGDIDRLTADYIRQ